MDYPKQPNMPQTQTVDTKLEKVGTQLEKGDLVERFGYHKATDKTGPIHQDIRGHFLEMAMWLNDTLPEGRAKSMAMTELESASMWANKAVAELAPISYS